MISTELLQLKKDIEEFLEIRKTRKQIYSKFSKESKGDPLSTETKTSYYSKSAKVINQGFIDMPEETENERLAREIEWLNYKHGVLNPALQNVELIYTPEELQEQREEFIEWNKKSKD
jgi:hypothetical protein